MSPREFRVTPMSRSVYEVYRQEYCGRLEIVLTRKGAEGRVRELSIPLAIALDVAAAIIDLAQEAST
jgi:hypothetical protein